jgi:chromosome segregation ATPase
MAEKLDAKEVLQRRLETQLKEWSTRIDHLKAEAERDMADAELREELYARLQKLRDMHGAAVRKLEELERAGAKAWKSVKKDIDRLWSDFQDGLDGGRSRRKKA